jgi:hypothetical protein
MNSQLQMLIWELLIQGPSTMNSFRYLKSHILIEPILMSGMPAVLTSQHTTLTLGRWLFVRATWDLSAWLLNIQRSASSEK